MCGLALYLADLAQCYSKFGDAAFTLTRFFKDKASIPAPKSLKNVPLPGMPSLRRYKIQFEREFTHRSLIETEVYSS